MTEFRPCNPDACLPVYLDIDTYATVLRFIIFWHADMGCLPTPAISRLMELERWHNEIGAMGRISFQL